MPAPPGPVLLVVDDDPAVLNSLKFALELEGYPVQIYASGPELLAAGDLPGAGCLVIDYNMPGMNGIELLGHLRDRHVALPALLITSAANTALQARAKAAGVFRIVEKPLLGNSLIDGIREALDSSGLTLT